MEAVVPERVHDADRHPELAHRGSATDVLERALRLEVEDEDVSSGRGLARRVVVEQAELTVPLLVPALCHAPSVRGAQCTMRRMMRPELVPPRIVSAPAGERAGLLSAVGRGRRRSSG